MEHNIEKLPFLDILLFKSGNKLCTDIYYKTTDTHQYLNVKSCHPRHVKHNIPYCLARRICTIVIEQDLRKKRLEELRNFLRLQKYPEKIITKGIQKAKNLSIEELRSPKKEPNNKESTLTMIITNNPNNPQITKKVKENVNILNNSQRMKNIMDNTKIIISRRQPKDLKQHLTKAQFSTQQQIPVVNKCDEPRCGTCQYILTGSKVTLKNGKQWTIKTTMNCKASNIVYTIICTKCQSFYVGQTEHLRKRVTLHKEQILHKEYRHLKVSKHLHSCSDGEFKTFPIYQCTTSSRLFRESKEAELINLLKPDLNAN